MLGRIMPIRNYHGLSGSLACLEDTDTDFFQVKRVFYIYGVPAYEIRGNHATRCSDLIMIPVVGEVTIQLNDGDDSEVYVLSEKCNGLYIPKMTWIAATNFSEDTVLLVLAQEDYVNSKYIYNYDDFINMKKEMMR